MTCIVRSTAICRFAGILCGYLNKIYRTTDNLATVPNTPSNNTIRFTMQFIVLIIRSTHTHTKDGMGSEGMDSVRWQNVSFSKHEKCVEQTEEIRECEPSDKRELRVSHGLI